MRITAEHVKELASLHGENVLVPMPCEHPPAGSLWVIGVENKHYDGAHTVYATSELVSELVKDSDCDADGDLTDEAAERIARELVHLGRDQAIESARQMKNPGGFTETAMRECEG